MPKGKKSIQKNERQNISFNLNTFRCTSKNKESLNYLTSTFGAAFKISCEEPASNTSKFFKNF